MNALRVIVVIVCMTITTFAQISPPPGASTSAANTWTAQQTFNAGAKVGSGQQLLLPDGSSNSPSVSFTSATSTGVFRSTVLGYLGITSNGNFQIAFDPTGGPEVAAAAISPNSDGGSTLGTVSSRFSTANLSGKMTTYNGLTTAGIGVIPVFGTPQKLTGQTAALGATSVLTNISDGVFRVCFDAYTTTAGTGTTGTVSVAWNDGHAKTFTSATWSLAATDVTGQVNGCIMVHGVNTSGIQVSTAGTFGTSVYGLDASVEQVQ